MLDRLFKYQKDNDIELEYFFRGSRIVVTNTSFAELDENVEFSDIESLELYVDDLRKSISFSGDTNVLFLNKKNIKIKDKDVEADVLPFKRKEVGFVLEKSNPDELARAVLCVNNIYKPIHAQSQEYKDLHKEGIVSYKNYKEKP
jgi:hypothetical protein